MNTFQLDFLEAESVFYSGECVSLVFPTVDGQDGVQANHSNAIAAIIPGTLEFQKPDGTRVEVAVSHGIIKVEDNQVLILVETAELPEEIDANRARRAKERAQEALLQKKSRQEYREAQALLARAVSRLRVKDRYSRKRGSRS